MPLYLTPDLFSAFTKVIAAESTRHGGVSPAPFSSLNLGLNTNDDADNVAENRRRFFRALTGDETERMVASSHQTHGTDVLLAQQAGRYSGYDALITDTPGLLLTVTVADCVPILIYDNANRAVAAVHAGWRGTAGAIVTKTLAAMQQQFGTTANECYAYVGTCIDQTSFEVGPEVAGQFAAAFRQVDPQTQKDCINLKGANRQQLLDFGIPASQIMVSSFSTVLNNDDYFSYRAEHGQTGRMLAAIGLRA
ncbi:peptidoglycan editing factor PgeF [Spirosoma sp. SC4-14]|uniref:peptidoglycan editing factor PgeF n=1 Tax=Spirosoma sp. SC4-14 TaxID=3128900 RepID=UPI0030CE6033